MKRVPHWFLAVAIWLSLAGAAAAHEVRPGLLELIERDDGTIDVLWKVPVLGQGLPLAGDEISHEPDRFLAPSGGPLTLPCGCPSPWANGQPPMGTAPIHPVLPEHWKAIIPSRTERLAGAELRRWTIASDADLNGAVIAIHGLERTMIDVLVRVQFADGAAVSRLLRPETSSFVIDHADAGHAPVGAFLWLGIEHILLGPDHLLFVLGLLMIVRRVGELVKTVTAFTIAHSITLGLATLGFVHVPSAPVEAVIALSILFLACELIRVTRGEETLTGRRPWLIAFTFGLLHGFGFAGALSEVGLPPGEVPLALLLFNLGVEAGQLVFVAGVLTLLALLSRLPAPRWGFVRRIPAYGIGAMASFWLISRVLGL